MLKSDLWDDLNLGLDDLLTFCAWILHFDQEAKCEAAQVRTCVQTAEDMAPHQNIPQNTGQK